MALHRETIESKAADGNHAARRKKRLKREFNKLIRRYNNMDISEVKNKKGWEL